MKTTPLNTAAQRILTTHVGSLPRPERVVTQLFAQDSGLNYNAAEFDTTMAAEVAAVVASFPPRWCRTRPAGWPASIAGRSPEREY